MSYESNMKKVYYSEKQTMKWIYVLMIPFIVILLIPLISKEVSSPIPIVIILGITFLLCAITYIFSALTIKITDTAAVASFKSGIFKKKISIDALEVENARVINTPLLWGIGYRFTPEGTLLNTRSGQALHIPTATSAFFVSTDHPVEILAAIKKAQEGIS